MSDLDELIAGLVTVWTPVASSDVTVIDGEPYDSTSTAGFLAVAWNGPEQPSASFTATTADLGSGSYWDTISVENLLSLQDNSVTYPQLRTAIYQQLRTFRNALRPDPVVGGWPLGYPAWVSSADFIHDAQTAASLVQFRFTVTAQLQP